MEELLRTGPDELVFVYDEPVLSPDGSRVELRYRVEGPAGVEPLAFTEVVTLPDTPDPRPVTDEVRRVARLLALAAGLSYYKALVPATMSVPGGLTPGEREFLTGVVQGGLGEFAFRNDVVAALTPRIEAPALPEPDVAPAPQTDPASALVAVGGGKDSIVTLDAIRATPVEVALFAVNSYAPITRTAEVAGLPLLTARRTLDPLLFRLNEAGALNGHVPVTAVNSLIGCLTALRAGIDTVVFSNEASSSYGNLRWEGFEVNHQWSKGLGFEGLLRDRLAGTGVDYVSFLRPLPELAIMRRFATLTDFHGAFISCNRAFHLDASRRQEWCGECPKCVFVFLLMAPFVPRARLVEIFGSDVITRPGNLALLLDLLAVGEGHKPFECVGEPDECRAAFGLLRRHPDWAGDPLLARPDLAGVDVDDAELARLFTFSERHFLTGILEKAARAVL
ncbi:MAG: hypothetical protein ACXVWV_02930 [Nocardioides sp.]